MHPSILNALNFQTPPKLIMFDLDGTLVDSAYDIAAAVDKVLIENQQPAAGEQRIRQWVGNGAERLIRRSLVWLQCLESKKELSGDVFEQAADKLEEKLVQKYLQQFLLAYQAVPIAKTVLYPGVEECLQTLHKQKIKMAVITNKPIDLTWPILKGLKIDHYFELVLGGDSLPEKKPSPMPLQHAMEKFLARSCQCVMVGDSKADIFAAQAAKVKVVAVDYGYSNGTPVQTWQPDYVTSNLSSGK